MVTGWGRVGDGEDPSTVLKKARVPIVSDEQCMDNVSNTSLAAKGELAHCLQCSTACKIQNGRQGAPKWQRGSGKVSTPRFLGVPVNLR